eukprot:1516472-Prymnesium_polylepis.1
MCQSVERKRENGQIYHKLTWYSNSNLACSRRPVASAVSWTFSHVSPISAIRALRVTFKTSARNVSKQRAVRAHNVHESRHEVEGERPHHSTLFVDRAIEIAK